MPALRPTIEVLRVMLPFLASTAALLSGYDVMKRSGLSKQTAYAVCVRLTKVGWLNGRPERINSRLGMQPRMLYEATPQGAAQARAVLDLLRTST